MGRFFPPSRRHAVALVFFLLGISRPTIVRAVEGDSLFGKYTESVIFGDATQIGGRRSTSHEDPLIRPHGHQKVKAATDKAIWPPRVFFLSQRNMFAGADRTVGTPVTDLEQQVGSNKPSSRETDGETRVAQVLGVHFWSRATQKPAAGGHVPLNDARLSSPLHLRKSQPWGWGLLPLFKAPATGHQQDMQQPLGQQQQHPWKPLQGTFTGMKQQQRQESKVPSAPSLADSLLSWARGQHQTRVARPGDQQNSRGIAGPRGPRVSPGHREQSTVLEQASRGTRVLSENPGRSHKFDVTDFGAKGDGRTDNTQAFKNAVYAVSTVGDKGGGLLYIPPGRYLTGCFNLTSNMTLFLAEGSVLLASNDSALWPVLPALPSYGRGREMPGPRLSSFIYGQDLTDVIITGNNGTVDGQGQRWWKWAREGGLNVSRGPLLQLVSSRDVVISNLTLLNSPYWALHPVYCRNVTIEHLTITSPGDAPDSGGIFPDSSTDIVIHDCVVSTGSDCIGVKSGWDEYGIQCNASSRSITVRDCQLSCANCSALSVGSEMSGGVADVAFRNIKISVSRVGFELRTAPGRGGFVQGVTVRGIVMDKVGTAISFLPMIHEHADQHYDPAALPAIADVTFENITGCEIGNAGVLKGLPRAPFQQINITHVHLGLVKGGIGFTCSDVAGSATDVQPDICDELMPTDFPFLPSHPLPHPHPHRHPHRQDVTIRDRHATLASVTDVQSPKKMHVKPS